jgi:hypothetical protein
VADLDLTIALAGLIVRFLVGLTEWVAAPSRHRSS